jgi:hypothetical protein
LRFPDTTAHIHRLTEGKTTMIPENADEIKSALFQEIGTSACWEDQPSMEVVSYGSDGTLWTVQLSGDVNVSKLAANLRERANLTEGFATCVETYEVEICRSEINSVLCKTVDLWMVS